MSRLVLSRRNQNRSIMNTLTKQMTRPLTRPQGHRKRKLVNLRTVSSAAKWLRKNRHHYETRD